MYISDSTANIYFHGLQKQCFSPAGPGHVELQVFLGCEVSPLNGVIEAVFVWIPQLIQLDVIVNERVSEHSEHEQHERLGRTV